MMLSNKTFSLCGVYLCKGFHKYPTLLRIDYDLAVEAITWQARATPTSYLQFYFSDKFAKYNNAWNQHLNFYPHEPKKKMD